MRIIASFPANATVIDIAIYGYCQMSCGYCFANLNRDAHDRELSMVNVFDATIKQAETEMANSESVIGYFLRHRYPATLSNTTDPFQREESRYRCTEGVLKWAKAIGLPLRILTRGNVLLSEFDRYREHLVPGKDVVYLSITHQDDTLRRKTEPGAMSCNDRWMLAKMLTDSGIPVAIACNPYVPQWVPDKDAFCEQAARVKALGIYTEFLHFNQGQLEQLQGPVNDYKDVAFIPKRMAHQHFQQWASACDKHGVTYFSGQSHNGCYAPLASQGFVSAEHHLGKSFDINLNTLQRLKNISDDNGRSGVIFGWSLIADVLDEMGVVNETIKTHRLMSLVYNSSHKRLMQGVLGTTTTLHDFLRWCWNNPWIRNEFLWHHSSIRVLTTEDCKEYVTDDSGEMLAYYDQAANCVSPKGVRLTDDVLNSSIQIEDY